VTAIHPLVVDVTFRLNLPLACLPGCCRRLRRRRHGRTRRCTRVVRPLQLRPERQHAARNPSAGRHWLLGVSHTDLSDPRRGWCPAHRQLDHQSAAHRQGVPTVNINFYSRGLNSTPLINEWKIPWKQKRSTTQF